MREHVVLCASAAVALLTMFFVPPDAAYVEYIDVKTLACLFGILAVVGALRTVGALEVAARVLSSRLATRRLAVLSLVGTTLVLSLFATNDMALVVMLPLSAAALLRAGWDDLIPFTFIMQNLAANLGGMILPFGNPQNLYLYECFDITLSDFLTTMAMPFVLSMALIVVCCTVFVRGNKSDGSYFGRRADARPRVSAQVHGGEHRPQSAGKIGARVSTRGEEGVFVDEANGVSSSAAAGDERSSVDPVRTTVYVVLFLLVVGSVLRLVPWPVALAAVVGVLAVLDRRALRCVDWGLLLTFVCFFVFAGNMARIPAVEELLAHGMEASPLLVSAGVSQVISNVPAAVLLSQVTASWQALLVGVNVGGAGTLVASLASLITFSHFRTFKKSFPRRSGLASCTTARFVALFSAFNFAFLAILLVSLEAVGF